MYRITGLFDTQSRREVDRARLQRMKDSPWRRKPDDGALQLESGSGFCHRHRRIVDFETTRRTKLSSVDDISVNVDGVMFATCLDANLTDQRMSDSTLKTIPGQLIEHLFASCSYIKGPPVNVLGLTFKEDCGDLRNSKVMDIINKLKNYGVDVFAIDRQAEAKEVVHERDEPSRVEAIVVPVAHRERAARIVDELRRKVVKGGAFICVMALADQQRLDDVGIRVWRF